MSIDQDRLAVRVCSTCGNSAKASAALTTTHDRPCCDRCWHLDPATEPVDG